MNIVVDRSFLIWLRNQDKDELVGELSFDVQGRVLIA